MGYACQYKVIKERLSFVPDTSFPCSYFFFFLPLFRVLPEVSAVLPRFMESRERCFLPLLVCTGPGPAGLVLGRRVAVVVGGGGTPLLSGKPALGETAPL